MDGDSEHHDVQVQIQALHVLIERRFDKLEERINGVEERISNGINVRLVLAEDELARLRQASRNGAVWKRSVCNRIVAGMVIAAIIGLASYLVSVSAPWTKG